MDNLQNHLLQEVQVGDDAAWAKLAQIFSALSDPVRLHILTIVSAEGHLCSCDLEKPTGKSQPTISHHTRVLAEAGLIKSEKRGKWVWWRINEEMVNFFRQNLEMLFGVSGQVSYDQLGKPENVC